MRVVAAVADGPVNRNGPVVPKLFQSVSAATLPAFRVAGNRLVHVGPTGPGQGRHIVGTEDKLANRYRLGLLCLLARRCQMLTCGHSLPMVRTVSLPKNVPFRLEPLQSLFVFPLVG